MTTESITTSPSAVLALPADLTLPEGWIAMPTTALPELVDAMLASRGPHTHELDALLDYNDPALRRAAVSAAYEAAVAKMCELLQPQPLEAAAEVLATEPASAALEPAEPTDAAAVEVGMAGPVLAVFHPHGGAAFEQDVTAWLAHKATPQTLGKLASLHWSASTSYDGIAREIADHYDLLVGGRFGVLVNEKQVRAWLEVHRPDIFDELFAAAV